MDCSFHALHQVAQVTGAAGQVLKTQLSEESVEGAQLSCRRQDRLERVVPQQSEKILHHAARERFF